MNPISNFNYLNNFETMHQIPESEEPSFASDLGFWEQADPSPKRREAADRIKHAFENKETKLNLKNLDLSDIPSCVGQLSELKVLYLENNNLESLPAEIGKLSQLEKLKLGHNNLKSLPTEIEQLSQLKVLNLWNNNLESLPAEIWQLSQLKSLILHSNNLKSLSTEIRQLSQLEVLNLWDNNLESLPTQIGQLSQLEVLNLWDNNLESLPTQIRQLSRLTRLHLGGNKLESLPAEIGQLSELEELDLNQNELESLPTEIGQLSKLKELSLEFNKLESLPDEIGQLSELKWLWLSENKLESLPAQIGHLSQLKWLFLENNNLKSLPDEIGQLSELKVLHLNGNHSLSSLPLSLRQIPELNIEGTQIMHQIPGAAESSFASALASWEQADPSPNRKEAAKRIKNAFENKGTELNLWNLYLSDIPSCIGQLSELKVLNLSDNNLKSLPTQIGQLSQLKRLDLNYNNLESLPAEIGQLSQLKMLWLGENNFKSLPDEIGKLSQLKKLDLRGNHSLLSLPLSLGQIPELNIEGTQIMHQIPGAAESSFASALESWEQADPSPNRKEAAKRIKNAFENKEAMLDLQCLDLFDIPSCVGQLSKLIMLDLGNLGLSDIPSCVGQLSQLKVLNLSDNNLKSLPDEIWQLSQLEVLGLSGNNLESFPDKIGQLSQLKWLYLWNNNLESLPTQIGQLSQLKELHLNGNHNLSDLPLSLGQIPELIEIDIEDTLIREDVRDTILNQCKVLREKRASEIFPSRLKRWGQEGQIAPDSLQAVLTFDEQKIKSLNEWLMRLENTKDFKSKFQKPLAKAVCKMLIHVTKDEDFQNTFFPQIEANLTCCQDRAAMALNEIYTSYKISVLGNSDSPEKKLQIMVRGAKTIALRKAIAECIDAYQKENSVIEEAVEIYLYYEMTLREKLNLLSIIKSMAYADIGKRVWIEEKKLVEKVEASYLDELVELPSFGKIIEDGEEYQKAYQKEMEPYQKGMEDLNLKEPKGVEEISSEYLDWQSEMRKLGKEQELAIKEFKKKWAERLLA